MCPIPRLHLAGLEKVPVLGEILSGQNLLVYLMLVALLLFVALRRRPDDRRRLDAPLTAWVITAVVQGTVGYVQYAAGLPEGVVLVHLAGATSLVGVTAWLWNSTSAPAPDARDVGQA